MNVERRWWNGNWGRIGRRDIWLMWNGQRWYVRGRTGGDEGREVMHQFDDETSARALVDRMMSVSAGQWRSLVDPLRREAQRRESSN